MSEEVSEAPAVVTDKQMVEILTAEMGRLQQVASDRLVWLRILEKAVNDVDSVVRTLKKDVAEIAQQVAMRNASQGITIEEPSEDEEESEPAEDEEDE